MVIDDWFKICLFLSLWISNLAFNEIPSQVPEGQIKKLYRHLFKDYMPEVRPVINDSLAVTISIQFWFKQILKVDEGDQILTIYCWLEEYWVDEYLTWEPSLFDNITVIHVPATKVWRPDLLVYNNANMNVEENELETNVIITNSGQITLFRSVITDITCNLALDYFPFDQQVCHLMLASWSFDGSKLLLEPYHVEGEEVKENNLDFYAENAEWKLEAFIARKNLKYYGSCCPYPYPDISYYFILRRNPGYYILSLIIPSGFITVVTIIGFFTPHSSSGENTEKVSLGVTALLSMAIIMMMVADEMPATSKVMPLIGKYYIGLIFIIFAAAFTTTITLSIQMRGNTGKPISPWARRLFLDYLPKYCMFTTVFLPEEFTEDFGGGNDIKDLEEQTYLFPSEKIGYTNGVDNVNRRQSPIPEILNAENRNYRKHKKTKHKILTRKSFRQVNNNNVANILRSSLHNQTKATEEHLENPGVYVEAAMEEVIRGIHSIDGELKERTRVELIIREWQQVTRIIERILMLFFIIATSLFAFVMLTDQGPELVLDDQLIKRFQTADNSSS